jgi:hypothetical protein
MGTNKRTSIYSIFRDKLSLPEGSSGQSKQGPAPEIGTENQEGLESEVTDGYDTYIHVSGDSIRTDVISPGEGGSDDNSDGSTALSSNHLLSGKALMYHQYLESKQKQGEEKKKKEANKQRKKEKKKNSSYCKEQDWKISI